MSRSPVGGARPRTTVRVRQPCRHRRLPAGSPGETLRSHSTPINLRFRPATGNRGVCLAMRRRRCCMERPVHSSRSAGGPPVAGCKILRALPETGGRSCSAFRGKPVRAASIPERKAGCQEIRPDRTAPAPIRRTVSCCESWSPFLFLPSALRGGVGRRANLMTPGVGGAQSREDVSEVTLRVWTLDHGVHCAGQPS